MDWVQLILWFIIGFVLTNGMRVLHILSSSKRKQLKYPKPDFKLTDYYKIVNHKYMPYLPVNHLFLWILCSIFYLNELTSDQIIKVALITGIIWLVLVIIFEMIFWVFTRHKLQLTWKEMYKDSQPWLTISYYAVLISPLLTALILK